MRTLLLCLAEGDRRSVRPPVVLGLLLVVAGVLGLLLGPVRAQAAFDHETAFSQLPADNFVSWEYAYKPSTQAYWYIYNYDFAKYSGYQELLEKFDRYLPSGSGLTVLQAESSHTPDAIGDVTHLFDYEASDAHSEAVANILSEVRTYSALYTRYTTFSVDLDSFHTADTADLRAFFPQMNSTDGYYPATDYEDTPITPAKLLNVSNTNGGSRALLIRQFDKFVEENDLVACTAHSSLPEGNWTTSGMAYNSLVVDQYYGNANSFDGAKLNDHGSPRYKPDLIARARLPATSYSAPTVCSAAAVLLERARVDDAVANAYNSVVVKALLMAGATRFNYRLSLEWSAVQEIADPPILGAEPLFYHGEWQRPSDALPTSPKYGAGHLHVLAAYDMLDAGEFDAGSSEAVGSRGWDYADGLAEADVKTYPLSITAESMFSAVLVWHRSIDDDFVSYLPDYEVSVYDSEETRVAHSDSLTANVELVEVKLAAGSYRLEVKVKSDGDSPDDLSYGLAWITKEIAPQPQNPSVDNSLSDRWKLSWDLGGAEADYKYRVQVSADAQFSTLEKDVYLDGATYTYPLPDGELTRYFRVFTYPQDGEVADLYPSLPRSVPSPAPPNTLATGQPVISGPPVVGETLTAVTTDIADANGLGAFRYQWRTHTGTTVATIPEATASTYTLQPADAGKTLTVQVSFTDGDGYAETLTSPATASVTAFSLMVSPATIPEMSGVATVTVSTGGPTFLADRTIRLHLSGTATPGVDYLVVAEQLTLSAGQSTVSTLLSAVDDHVVEGSETILVTASHRGRSVGPPLTLTLVDDERREPPPPPPPPGGTGGGGGGGGSGGGNGGSSRPQDQHGNSPAQASPVPIAAPRWTAATPGQINPADDSDYFALTLPHEGVLVVETTGSTDTVGTVWQDDEELGMADSGGARQNFRLVVPVEAGPVVVAVTGNGRRTGSYVLETTLIVGTLENPGPDSFQSGVGVLSGWVCAADMVEVEINGVPHRAGYGTERGDTLEMCGDSDNGFGLLFNWNRLGEGEHEVVASVDRVELGRATVTVTTLGAEFLRDAAGECVVEDFPSPGETVVLMWQETSQNFVLTSGVAPASAHRAGTPGVGYLENPGPNAFQSGVGVISGWVCEADTVEIVLGDLAPQPAAYGTERTDTLEVCGDPDNGFGLLFNWNRLGEGEHAVIAYVDGEEFGQATVRVTTLGEEFVRGAVGACTVADFPLPGETVTLEWQQNHQNFVMTGVE